MMQCSVSKTIYNVKNNVYQVLFGEVQRLLTHNPCIHRAAGSTRSV